MKKSLSLAFALVLVFSLFSSVAFAADASTSASASAPTLQQMMQDLGFTGTTHTNLDRADAAVSIIKGLGIKVDTSAPLPFKDVSASDAWAPYIATAYELGIVHGVDSTHYQPFKTISQQDYTIELVEAYASQTGTKIDTTATANVKASAYAQAYIKAAMDLGLVGSSDDWTVNAAYDWMVSGAYQAKQAVAKATAPAPAQVSVTAAKAVGVQKVEVDLNKAVDTTKATFTVSTGGSSVTVDKTDWSSDNTTATLELDSKIVAGDYTVTLGGLDASAIDQASATFTAQDEAVKSIQFLTGSDTLPYSKHVTIKLKALNQYGENVSMGAADFTAYVSGTATDVTTDDQGYLEIQTDTTSLGYTQGNGVVPVTVYENTSRVQASKNFKLGTSPFPSNVEIGQVTYSNGNDSLQNVGDTASIALKVYDQYGNEMTSDQFADTTGGGSTADAAYSTLNAIITPYDNNVSYEHSNDSDYVDANGNLRALIKLTNKEDKNKDLTVTAYAGSGSATTTIHVGAGATPVKVQFGSFTDHVAQGDTGTYYMPIVAYDANGNQLSAQDIVDNATKFSITVSNAGSYGIQMYGEHKGQVYFTLANNVSARNILYFTVVVANADVNTSAQKQVTVESARYPDKVTIDTTPKQEYLAGASDTLSFDVKDQYGSDIGAIAGPIPDSNNSTSYNYQYVVSVTGDTYSGLTVTDKTNNVQIPVGGSKQYDSNTGLAAVNGDIGITADNTTNTGTLTVKLTVQREAVGGSSWTDIASNSFTVKKIASDSSLTYSVNTIPTLFAVKDKLDSYAPNLINSEGNTPADDAINSSWFSYKVGVSAKDSAGNTVALPIDPVRSVSSSNSSVVDAAYTANSSSISNGDGANLHAYLLGNTAGTATITVTAQTNKGNDVVLSQNVTVKDDPITVTNMTTDNTSINYDNTVGTDSYPDVYHQFNDLKVYDQYGNEYDGLDGEIAKYNELLGITFAVTDIDTTANSGNGTVTINKDGAITNISGNVKAFVITATAPNGKSVSVTVDNVN